jgi:hypothetical protein
MIIPSRIVKEQELNTSTIFVIRAENKERIILERISTTSEKQVSVEESVEASTQQIPSQ